MTTQTDSNVTNNSTGPDQTEPPANGTRPPSAQDENRADPKDATVHAALPGALKAIASVVAPGTIVTALMIYFGLLYTVGYYRHFGVNYTVLELPVQDYLILSADAAVVPL